MHSGLIDAENREGEVVAEADAIREVEGPQLLMGLG